MDEIFFRLSNQFEAFQIQASLTTQQSQQYLNTFASQCHRTFQNISQDLHRQEFKEFFQQILSWIQKQIHTINYYASSINFNPRHIYQQFSNLYIIDVSKKEFICCLTGIFIGIFIGYSIALSQHTSRNVNHMKAIVCHYYLGIESVSVIEDAEMPTIKNSDEILIQVKAASIHEVDLKICSGYSKAYRRLLNNRKNKDLPVVLGRDCAGIIVDIGQKVADFDIGDKVFLAVPSWFIGTMSEYIVVSQNQIAKMPNTLSFEACASLPYSGCLAWDAIVNKSVIKEGNATGKRVLIYGGSTPVGCILIQLIKVWGGHVVTVCKLQALPVVKALGADEIIVFESDIFKLLEVHDKFDAIFYTGGLNVDEKILKKYLLPQGSYVSTVNEDLISDSLGFISGSLFSGFIRLKLLAQYIFGTGSHQWKDGSKIKTAYLQSIQQLVDSDQLRPVFDGVYAPHCIDQALLHVLDSKAIGSTVIKF